MELFELDNIISEFPPQMQVPVRHLTAWLHANQSISREDFSELKLAIQDLTVAQAHTDQKVSDLAEAQERTDQKVQNLAGAMQRLAEAQERTEQKVQNLAEAQERTEQKVQRLAEAQERTDQKVQNLAGAMQRLAEAQERTEQKVQNLAEAQERTEQTLSDKIAALGGRWGICNEITFRSTIRGLLKNMEGITVEEGFYGGRQVDVIIRNGEHIMLEITSRMNSKDIKKLYCSADDYRDKTGTEPKLMVAATYIPPIVMRKIIGLERPIEIFSYGSEDEE
ncbi:DUF3782 domain-containing protein [Desulfococcaceae bacterium HSG8]|nr:DUF3782 domain-containing protein [Desulfococcaceae bacterium HSG8]